MLFLCTLPTNWQMCLREMCGEQDWVHEKQLHSWYRKGETVQELISRHNSLSIALRQWHLSSTSAMCPSRPQEYSERKHRPPWGVLSAIACQSPQLVPFHFIAVSAASSRNDRNRTCSSETLSWKPANHICEANQPAHCAASVASQPTAQALEVLSDMSDLLIVD